MFLIVHYSAFQSIQKVITELSHRRLQRRGQRKIQFQNEFKFFTNFVASITIREKSQMQANFPGADFLRTAFKFRKRQKNSSSLVHVLHKGDVTRDDSQRRFLAQHSVATLFRITTTLFQHWNPVLRYKSSLRIVRCKITLKREIRDFHVEVVQ